MPLSHNFTASPPNLPGYFSPPTSVVNFCEIDYEITPYLAEFINSLTNLTYVVFAFTTLPRTSHPFKPLSWPACNISLVAVGVGSFIFHATLKHTAQIVDEIGMYAITGSLNYAVYTGQPTQDAGSLTFTTPLSKSLLGGFLLLSTVFVAYGNYITRYNTGSDIHTALFVLMLSTFWPRILYLINHSTRQSSPNAKATRSRRLATFRTAALSFCVGFGIWVCDGIYCHQLRSIRATIGLPFAWIFEFHGLWHILTAIGAAMFVRLSAELADERAGSSKRSTNGVSKKVTWEAANGKENDGQRSDASSGSVGSDGSEGSAGSDGSDGSGKVNGASKSRSRGARKSSGKDINANGTTHKKNKSKK